MFKEIRKFKPNVNVATEGSDDQFYFHLRLPIPSKIIEIGFNESREAFVWAIISSKETINQSYRERSFIIIKDKAALAPWLEYKHIKTILDKDKNYWHIFEYFYDTNTAKTLKEIDDIYESVYKFICNHLKINDEGLNELFKSHFLKEKKL